MKEGKRRFLRTAFPEDRIPQATGVALRSFSLPGSSLLRLMKSAARFFWPCLTAVLVSIAIGWAPTATWAQGAAVAEQATITLSPPEGPPGASVHIDFESCTKPGPQPDGPPDDLSPSPSDDDGGFAPPAVRAAAGVQAGVITGVYWDSRLLGPGSTFDVPDDADAGSHTIGAYCSDGAYGSATFTVTPAHDRDPGIVLDPTSGSSGTSVTVTGSLFSCSEVSVSWDGGDALITGARVSAEGDFEEDFDVPEGSSVTTHTVRAACTQYADTYYADADFRVTDTESGDGTSNGGTDGESNGTGHGTTGATDPGAVGGTGGGGGGTGIPAGWVIGPSVFGAVLLLALLFSPVNPLRRGPHWVRDHIGTALRFGSTTVALRERRDGGSANRTVRLEPHPDQGDQRFH